MKFSVFFALLFAFQDLKTTASHRRIINGTPIKEPSEFPYQGILYIAWEDAQRTQLVQICGAAVISAKYLLTAAHCFNLNKIFRISLGLGVKYTRYASSNQTNTGAQWFDLDRHKNIQIHPRFHTNPNNNDIAIIKLDSPAKLNKNVQPIPLVGRAEAKKSFIGEKGLISGFGLKDYRTFSEIMRHAQVMILNGKSCEALASFEFGNFYCLKGINRQQMWNGDSGSPLTIKSARGKDMLIGIASTGFKDEIIEDPFLYVKVGNYLDWIKSNTDAVVPP